MRVAARSRRRRAAGLILGEDRSGAIQGLRGLSRQTPGGHPIPAKQSTGVANKANDDGTGDGPAVRDGDRRGHTRVGEPPGRSRAPRADSITRELTADQRALLGDLFAVIEEHKADAAEPIDRQELERAFAFACESHAGQERKSGEDFITHPLGVARICAGLRLDTATLCAALLHDTVEDTSASLDQVRDDFGDEIAQLVDGVTKLTGITFKSRDERQAENYRKMMVAMATDVRVILIKLADRLHNMRTIGALPKQKQQEKARETLEIFAPARAPPRDPRDQVGARGSLLRHPPPAQVRRDQGARRPAARRARALRRGGRQVPRQGAREGGHRGRDLRPRQALLLDLHEDDPQGQGVQRDLRSDRDARPGRLGEGLLRGDRDRPLALEAAARPLQGLRRHAQGERLPGAPHDRDRPGRAARSRSRSARRRCTSSPSTGSPPT